MTRGIVIITSPPFLVLGRWGVRCCAMCMWWWWWWCSTNELLTRDYTHTERRVINKHTHPSTPGDSHKKLGGYSIPYISRLSFSSSSNNLSAIIKRSEALEGANVKYLWLLLGLIFFLQFNFCVFFSRKGCARHFRLEVNEPLILCLSFQVMVHSYRADPPRWLIALIIKHNPGHHQSSPIALNHTHTHTHPASALFDFVVAASTSNCPFCISRNFLRGFYFRWNANIRKIEKGKSTAPIKRIKFFLRQNE